jgi:hypothetical protein
MRQEAWSCVSARDNQHTSPWLALNGSGVESVYFFICDWASFGLERWNHNTPWRFLVVPDNRQVSEGHSSRGLKSRLTTRNDD